VMLDTTGSMEPSVKVCWKIMLTCNCKTRRKDQKKMRKKDKISNGMRGGIHENIGNKKSDFKIS